MRCVSYALLLNFASLLLSGCVGSTFIDEPEQKFSAQFPSLHEVPDRPTAPDLIQQKATETTLTNSYQKDLEEHQKLRHQFALSSDRSCPQSPAQ